jgi:hypothetical protein
MRAQRSFSQLAVVVGAALIATIGALLIAGCESRMNSGAYAPDSTLVYGSRRASDISATISFALKGSKKAEEARRAAIEAKKRAEEERKAAIEAKKRAEAERKAAEAKKAGSKKKGSSKKGKDAKKKAAPKAAEVEAAAPDTVRPVAKKTPKPPKLVEDRVFEIEEGARVQATITLTNRLARGPRPLLLHFVWIRPGGIRTYKKLIEFDPTGTDSTLTGALTISPDKRAAGDYKLRLYLFRELIAEKSFTLSGTGLQETEEGESQM